MTPTAEDECGTIHYRVAGAIIDRYRGGESMDSLARDYALPFWLIGYICHGRRHRSPPAFGYVCPPLPKAETERRYRAWMRKVVAKMKRERPETKRGGRP